MKILICVTFVALIAFVIMFFSFKRLKGKYEKLQEAYDAKDKAVSLLQKHISELGKIEEGKTKARKKLKEAKNEEDVKKAAADIINSNNSKLVQNGSK